MLDSLKKAKLSFSIKVRKKVTKMEPNKIPVVDRSSDSRPSHSSIKINKTVPRLVRKSHDNWKKLVIVLVVIIFALLGYGYIHTRNQLKQLSNPKIAAHNETQNLTAKIDKLVQLPVGETPTVATVNDVSKLKGQPFFKNAQNGDKVLIYTKANQAILYRPSSNKVIQFSTVNLGANQ